MKVDVQHVTVREPGRLDSSSGLWRVFMGSVRLRAIAQEGRFCGVGGNSGKYRYVNRRRG